MRVFDCVIVASEADLDLLEARFTELADLDVVHVIAEAPVDWQGNPKPLWFWENACDTDAGPGRFTRWHGRWNHVRAEARELPAKGDAKARKDALREYLAHGVAAEPDDVVLHGNADEIPAEWAVREIAEQAGTIALPAALEMRWCAYGAGRVHPLPWRGTVAQEWRMTGSFAGMREKRASLPAIVNAGTRMSMWGQEPPGDGKHPDGHALWEAEPDGTWPRWVRERA